MAARVAIIGTGPCGLSQLMAFEAARKKGAKIPEIVAFEKQSDWGGLWNYTWRTGLDENGEPVHGSMYRYLWSNGPKECLEFADYTFDRHFRQPIPSYPPREVLYDYITGRAKKSGVRKHIRFATPVRFVEFDNKTEKFNVTSEDLQRPRRRTSENFDFVIVATGHFSIPNVPNFEGIEKFPGRVMHAPRFSRRAGIFRQAPADRRRQLFRRGHRAPVPQIRGEARHHVLAHQADGLSLAEGHGRAPAPRPSSRARRRTSRTARARRSTPSSSAPATSTTSRSWRRSSG